MRDLTCIPVAENIAGCEGPLVTRDGRLFVVEPDCGNLLELDRVSGARVQVISTSGIPAGLQLHTDGSIWIADMRRGILRWDERDGLREIVSTYDGAAIRGTNDLAFDSQGNLYFTAPAGSSRKSPCGEIFCRLADGSVRQLDNGFAFCNGIAISRDDRTLIVAETFTKRLFAYTIESPGILAEKRFFALLPGDHHGGADGLDFDGEGNLLVAHWGAGCLDVYAEDGRHIERVGLPFAKPSNIHFGGPDSRVLFIAEHTTNALWRAEWTCVGQKQFGWRDLEENLP